ncbi:hypothetical protein MBLNU457_5037t2 [Dothideomycetes sp. NU457]
MEQKSEGNGVGQGSVGQGSVGQGSVSQGSVGQGSVSQGSGSLRRNESWNGSRGEDKVLVVGFWVRTWHHQFMIWLDQLLARDVSRAKTVQAYLLVEHAFAVLDFLSDPQTGGTIDLNADIEVILTQKANAANVQESEMADELQQLCCAVFLAGVGGFTHKLKTQLSAQVCKQHADFSSWIKLAIKALEEGYMLILEDICPLDQFGQPSEVGPKTAARADVNKPAPARHGRPLKKAKLDTADKLHQAGQDMVSSSQLPKVLKQTKNLKQTTLDMMIAKPNIERSKESSV